MERDNASDCPRRAPRHYMHIRASIDVTLLQFSSSRSLSLTISEKKNGNASCTSGSTCLQTVPHRTKTNLQATLRTTRITPLQFSKWAMKKQTKKTEENNARALPEKFCRKNTPMWIETQTQTIPIWETMRSQWSGILERRSREMEARQRSAGREREASRQRKGRAKKKPRQ